MQYKAVICAFIGDITNRDLTQMMGRVMYLSNDINEIYRKIEGFNAAGPWRIELKEANQI